MTKRLVKLRGTEDFRRVKARKGAGENPGGAREGSPLWLACNPSPFEEAIKGVRYVHITPIKTKVTAIPFSKTSPFLVPVFAKLETSAANGGAWQPVKAFKPTSFFKPSLPCQKKNKFTEQTFEQVQRQYINNNIAQSGGNNAEPMEIE